VAIGSEPEIGVEFTRWGLMTDESRRAWFRYMTDVWGPDLMHGMGTLVHLPGREGS